MSKAARPLGGIAGEGGREGGRKGEGGREKGRKERREGRGERGGREGEESMRKQTWGYFTKHREDLI